MVSYSTFIVPCIPWLEQMARILDARGHILRERASPGLATMRPVFYFSFVVIDLSDPAACAHMANMNTNRQCMQGHWRVAISSEVLLFFCIPLLCLYTHTHTHRVNCLCAMRVNNGIEYRKCISFTHSENSYGSVSWCIENCFGVGLAFTMMTRRSPWPIQGRATGLVPPPFVPGWTVLGCFSQVALEIPALHFLSCSSAALGSVSKWAASTQDLSWSQLLGETQAKALILTKSLSITDRTLLES